MEVADAKTFLNEVAEAGREASVRELVSSTELFLALTQICEAAEQESGVLENHELQELRQAVDTGVDAVKSVLEESPGAVEHLTQLVEQTQARWGESLDLVTNDHLETSSENGWPAGMDAGDPAVDHEPAFDLNDSFEEAAFDETTFDESLNQADADDVDAAGVDINQILDELKAQQNEAAHGSGPTTSSGAQAVAIPAAPKPPTPQTSNTILDDPEMVEAYLDDALRCVASMEESLLAYEADTNNRAALNQLCRELHTLKGASASVELTDLAAFLHEVEDLIRAGCEEGSAAPDPNTILQSIDAVRQQINTIGGGATKSSDAAPLPLPTPTSSPTISQAAPQPATAAVQAPAQQPAASASSSFLDQGAQQGATLRVKAAQVDRLMDMLAELVMLRNRRESRVEGLKSAQNELLGCASRVRGLDSSSNSAMIRRSRQRPAARSNSYTEVADDIFATTNQIRDLYEPLAAENLAISRFIRQFRQELVEIRRVPAAGLFRRLQRAVRDAAKAEQKQVRLEFVGEQTGIDRTLQESLYDPLLHIVRNAVSHGVELPQDRVATGKDASGVVTLEARSGANFLVVEVRDDGKGLDYDALRRRGLQQNLLKSNQPASNAELAQLIFQPGFSTRSDTSEISGRGVGMDVVASAIERLRGWIEIESTPGQGSCMRITVPLQSTIEHAMLFRNNGQVFALPMRFVHTVHSDDQRGARDLNGYQGPEVVFAEIFGERTAPREDAQRATLIVGYGGGESGGENTGKRGKVRVALEVDEIVGPEEVVMRPLPSLLRQHRLYSGLSLAGSGEIVLVFDTQQLLEKCLSRASQTNASHSESQETSHDTNSDHQLRALVVDDSVTARRAMVGMLKQRGFTITEAADGAEGLETLGTESFDLLVSDLEMPRMDGLELLEAVRANPAYETMPAIISSSRDDDVFQTRARELGAAAYLIKPVAEERLDEVLAKCSFRGERVH